MDLAIIIKWRGILQCLKWKQEVMEVAFLSPKLQVKVTLWNLLHSIKLIFKLHNKTINRTINQTNKTRELSQMGLEQNLLIPLRKEFKSKISLNFNNLGLEAHWCRELVMPPRLSHQTLKQLESDIPLRLLILFFQPILTLCLFEALLHDT